MEVENRNKIKDIKVLYPEYVASNFKQLVLKEYKDILDSKKHLSELRVEANELEAKIKEREKTFRELSPLFKIEYETKDLVYNTNECSLAIINREDARNI